MKDVKDEVEDDVPIKDEVKEEQSDEKSSPIDDDMFSSFLNDVKSIPTTEKAPPKPSGLLNPIDDKLDKKFKGYEVDHVDVDWKTSNDQVDRIIECLKRGSSHFDILLAPPYASKELIKKHFRKLSVLIHPDKCDHEEAHTAFMAVKKSFEELQKPEYRAKYMDVIEEAKEQLIKEKKEQAKKGKKTAVEETDEDLRKATIERCDQILKEREERIAYAEKTRMENELRLQRLKAEQEAEEYRKQLERNKWLEKRDERVGHWREFREQVVFKKLKTNTGEKPTCVKAGGLDESYKKTWR
eukprot:Blabericola_migrator_1__18@NODE_1005_length_5722_cov_152_220336_g691_i0_p3_GENE_NODE_1005_length_5722_cov_152_220336_g691_i0NODE_1005_length_5722_cov_152_220336_g691_i0_p3_ORF_typecomplete_len298_score94_74DnaJ/PF00226_31/6_1e14DnaJ/PF00226_31/1_7e03Mitofilin/PF09731_9/0_12LPD30/PF18850_1/0_18LPD30/PF18850_1/9_7e02LPD30/PF18850_1/3_4e03Eco57I/PF07669_11/6_8Gluconate_2dh3/PF13618_6/18_NODE_1005_length_5722_cov_152_220336_g691_i015052398